MQMTASQPHRQVYASMWAGSSLDYMLQRRNLWAAWRKWLDFVAWHREQEVSVWCCAVWDAG